MVNDYRKLAPQVAVFLATLFLHFLETDSEHYSE